MTRLLYFYPEEWTGRRAREVHTLQTCLALAEAGLDVTLITGSGFRQERALRAVGRKACPARFHHVKLSRRILMVRSWQIFRWKFRQWIRRHGPFDVAYLIHLKAVPVVLETSIPFWWEAHEVFAETPAPETVEAIQVDALEQQALEVAAGLVATSQALAHALTRRYQVKRRFQIVPHGGGDPVPSSLAEPGGPLVYAGSIANWKGLDVAIEAAARARIPLRIIGGTAREWKSFLSQHKLSEAARRNVHWRSRVALDTLPERLSGCRAGLSPTRTETPSGRYSLPMKLYDYARCGIPAISTRLPSLDGLGTEAWCRQVVAPTVEAWTEALRQPINGGDQALAWAAHHTWRRRGELLARLLRPSRPT